MVNEVKRSRLPLLVEHRLGNGGIFERIEVDFEQVLRDEIPMREVGKVRINPGIKAISTPSADKHYEMVNRWGAQGSSLNNFIGAEVAEDYLRGAIRRFACYGDVVELDDGRRLIDWKTVTPGTRWLEETGIDCFEANRKLFLQVREGGKVEGQERIIHFRQEAMRRAAKEIHSLATDTYQPLLSESLVRGGPAQIALLHVHETHLDSEPVANLKRMLRTSEAGKFLYRVMEVVDDMFARERESYGILVERYKKD